jgi:hypothetical protein
VEVLVEQGAPEDEARCVAEELDGLSEDDIRTIAHSDDPADLDPEIMEQFISAVMGCGIGEG